MTEQRQRAIVTGAARGIGYGAAKRLLEEGVSVTAVDINETGLQQIKSEGATILVADLAAPEARARAIEAGQGIDYLVNAAGIIRLKPIWEFTVEDWRQIFTVNAESIFFLCQGIGPTMPAGGSIVNLSSTSAKLTSTTEASVYAASKAAIAAITRSFAYALAPRNVRCNCICPGIIDTPMQDAVLEEVSRARGMTVEQLSAARLGIVPLGRSASTAEIAGLIWFLLSPEAGYMTGQSINYSGGMVMW